MELTQGHHLFVCIVLAAAKCHLAVNSTPVTVYLSQYDHVTWYWTLTWGLDIMGRVMKSISGRLDGITKKPCCE